MDIGIATFAAHRIRTGIGTYIVNLVSALLSVDCENRYLLFASDENASLFPQNGGKVRKLTASRSVNHTALRLIWEHTILPMRLHQHKVDVFHGPTFVTPLFSPCPTVVTIADMTWFTHSEHHILAKRRYFQTLIPLVARKAHHIIAMTDNTKKDIVRILHLPEDKVTTVYCGVDSSFHPVTDPLQLAEVKRRYHIDGDFILFVGIIEPRKNLVRLVDAFCDLKRQGVPHTLVLAGPHGWGYAEVAAHIRERQLDKHVHFTGPVAQEDLPVLFSAADLFVYPSLYEGFGLPPLEAMACGVPVVTSNVSALPEVVGDAGVLVDPLSVEDLRAAMWKVLSSNDLHQQLRARGFAQARRFTWENTARRTLQVYQNAYGSV